MKDPETVLLFSHTSNLSGAPISLVQLAGHLPARGFSPVVCIPARGPIEKVLQEYSIPYRIMGGFGPASFIESLRAEKPAVVHVNSTVTSWPVLIARSARRPVVWHIREYMGDKRGYARLIHALSTRVVLISKEQYALFADLPRAVLIPNGVDLARYRGAPPAPDLILDGNGHPITTVTCIGSIEERKGLMVLARAAWILRDRPWIRYVVVGASPGKGADSYKEAVVDFLREKALQKRFHFTGKRSDIPAVLSASDILCHPAFIEAFGRVLVEAMASGLPVVCSRAGAMADIVEHGKTGYLFDPGDHVSLARSIKTLDDNVPLRKSMGEAGRKRAAVYSMDAHADRIAALYRDILENEK